MNHVLPFARLASLDHLGVFNEPAGSWRSCWLVWDREGGTQRDRREVRGAQGYDREVKDLAQNDGLFNMMR